jgi:putative nucleotidyltransferase with HDIG domain
VAGLFELFAGAGKTMKIVIVASTNSKEAQKISGVIPQDHKVAIIESSDKLKSLINSSSMLILDHSFYEKCGLAFFKELLKHPAPPIFMLAPPNDTLAIVKIMEIGIHYIPKIPGYPKLLSVTAKNALAQIHQQELLNQNVSRLEQRVKELETAGNGEKQIPDKSSEAEKAKEEKSNILDEIVFVFKRGEIELPALPQMGIKFQEMMNKGANLHDIGELLKQDMAISSKLISVSNSAYYRGVTKSKNLGQAIGRLGLRSTKQYVDTICNRTLYATKNKKFMIFLERLWEHSLACASAAQTLDNALALNLENDAFTMGLLHDIGKLLLFQVIGQLQLKKKLGDEVEVSELLSTVDTHHAKFGAALLKKWEFPESFSNIASYHNNLEAATSISNELLVVHFANLMAKSMGYSLNDQEETQQPEIDLKDTESARRLGLETPMIDEFKDKVTDFMGELKGVFA